MRTAPSYDQGYKNPCVASTPENRKCFPYGVSQPTLGDLARRIVELEKRGLWSEAKEVEAKAVAMSAGVRSVALFHHTVRGEILATCEQLADGRFAYAGVIFSTLNKAAAAAAKVLGKSAKNGLRFWGAR